MRARFLVVGTLLGALVLYAWQSLSNTVIPWHAATVKGIVNDSTAAHVIRALIPENGVYFSRFGVFAAVNITPGFTDKTTGSAIVATLASQLAIDVAATFVLALLLLRLPMEAPFRTGTTLALGALAVAGVVHLSEWNWYNFSPAYTIVNLLDQAIAFFLVGATLSALRGRFDPMIRTAERPGVRAPGNVHAGTPGARVSQ